VSDAMPANQHRRWTAAEDARIREMYDWMPGADLARALGRSKGALYQHAGRLGLHKPGSERARGNAALDAMRQQAPALRDTPGIRWAGAPTMARKTFIVMSTVHDYFREVTTADQAYILGLLAADGCIGSEHPRVTLGLQAKDASAVEFVRDRLNPEANLCPVADGRVVLQVTSQQMVTDLARYGIVPRKTRILVWPSWLGELQRLFLLGYFDGDGSIFLPRDRYGQERPGWTVCSGSEKFLIEMKYFVMASAGVRLQKIQKRRNADLWQVAVTGHGAFVMDEWLHREGLGLARKRPPEDVVGRYRTQ
jgi:hypothetical protein